APDQIQPLHRPRVPIHPALWPELLWIWPEYGCVAVERRGAAAHRCSRWAVIAVEGEAAAGDAAWEGHAWDGVEALGLLDAGLAVPEARAVASIALCRIRGLAHFCHHAVSNVWARTDRDDCGRESRRHSLV